MTAQHSPAPGTPFWQAHQAAWWVGYEAGYRDGYEHGLANAPRPEDDPDPGPDDGPEPVVWGPPEPLPLPAGPDYPRPHRTGKHRRRHTAELLQEVARVFWQNGPESWQRMNAVAAEFEVSKTTAGRYIRDARLAGILPPDPNMMKTKPRAGRAPRNGDPDDEPPPW